MSAWSRRAFPRSSTSRARGAGRACGGLMEARPVRREEHPADAALSELVVPAVEPGSHRLRLRVTEDGRTASLADWALDVGTTPVVAETPAPDGGIVAGTERSEE